MDQVSVTPAAPVANPAPAAQAEPTAKVFSPAEANKLMEAVKTKEALFAQLKAELATARQQLKSITSTPNKHLIGVDPKVIIAGMPKQIRVDAYFDGQKVGELMLTPEISKSGMVGCADQSNVVINLADGTPPIVAKVKAAIFVPIGEKKKKVKPADGEAKKKHKKKESED